MIVYISGVITNDKHYRRKFAKAERKLKRRGYDVINPAKISDSLPQLSWNNYMDIDKILVQQADMIYMLSDWRSSVGANIEHGMAKALGKDIVYEVKCKKVENWLLKGEDQMHGEWK